MACECDLSSPVAICEVSQLRSSISWLARTFRPDLCHEANRLPVQSSARIQDLIDASLTLQFKTKGIFHSSSGPKFDSCMILSITDASHAASFVFLFCTSMDAVCAVCTGHHSKDGNSASREEEKTKTNNRNPQKDQPNKNPPSNHFQSFELYRRVKQSETWIDCNWLLGPRILEDHLLLMLVERLCALRLRTDQPGAYHWSAPEALQNPA